MSLTSLQVPHRNFRVPDGPFIALLYWNSQPLQPAQILQRDARWSLYGTDAQFVPHVGRVAILFHEPKFTLARFLALFFYLFCMFYSSCSTSSN